MSVIVELARPKVNLHLRVLGRQPDGYHALESLVAFADGVADKITLEPEAPASIRVTGPFGATIAGENLIAVTLQKLSEACPDLKLGAVTLEKNLPVASGLGGGSSDAAAVIRAVRRANPALQDRVDWTAIGTKLGADVPVCLINEAAVMRGIGDRLTPLRQFPPLPAVLVNPLVRVPDNKTARVFRLMAAKPLPGSHAEEPSTLLAGLVDGEDGARIASTEHLLSFLREQENDLTRPATEVVPEVRDVLSRLETFPRLILARLSGAGPTCFALFVTRKDAEYAAQELQRADPQWWAKAVVLG